MKFAKIGFVTLKQFTNDTRVQVAFTLSLVWILAIWHSGTISSFTYPLVAIASVTIADMAITWLRDYRVYWPFSSFVTGLLIGLVIAPVGNIWVIIGAAVFASLSKQFIKKDIRQHIFNPAAFGILSSSILFQVPVAWWGVAWGIWPSIILIPLMGRILLRLKRLILPITFLMIMYVYLLINYFFVFEATALKTNLGDFLNFSRLYFLDGTLILFAMVMLPEPITSPAGGKFKYFYGVLVAVIAILVGLVNIKLSYMVDEVFLTSLLLANLISFGLIKLRKTPNKSFAANKK